MESEEFFIHDAVLTLIGELALQNNLNLPQGVQQVGAAYDSKRRAIIVTLFFGGEDAEVIKGTASAQAPGVN